MEPVFYAGFEEDCTSGLVIEVFEDLDKVGAVVVLLHVCCESWTLTAELQGGMRAIEMGCCRRVLRVSYRDHVASEGVCVRIRRAIGPHEDLLTIVEGRRLRWCGHVPRSSGLAETILQGTVKGGGRRGRRRRGWEDNIVEWTGLEFGRSRSGGERGRMERAGCEIICGAQTTLADKG